MIGDWQRMICSWQTVEIAFSQSCFSKLGSGDLELRVWIGSDELAVRRAVILCLLLFEKREDSIDEREREGWRNSNVPGW